MLVGHVRLAEHSCPSRSDGMSTDRPTPADYESAVGGATHRVVTMQRTVTRPHPGRCAPGHIAVAKWRRTPPVLRLKNGAAQYTGTYIVFDYHWDGEEITIKGLFRPPIGKT